MVKTTFDVLGMHCASCAATIQKAVKKLKGVKVCDVNYGPNKMVIEYDPRECSTTEIRQAVDKTGYKLG